MRSTTLDKDISRGVIPGEVAGGLEVVLAFLLGVCAECGLLAPLSGDEPPGESAFRFSPWLGLAGVCCLVSGVREDDFFDFERLDFRDFGLAFLERLRDFLVSVASSTDFEIRSDALVHWA